MRQYFVLLREKIKYALTLKGLGSNSLYLNINLNMLRTVPKHAQFNAAEGILLIVRISLDILFIYCKQLWLEVIRDPGFHLEITGGLCFHKVTVMKTYFI